MSTQIGAQASNDQFEKILSYLGHRAQGGVRRFSRGVRPTRPPGELAGGYYIKPTVFEGNNKMRVFQEEIFWTCGLRHDLRYSGTGVGDRE